MSQRQSAGYGSSPSSSSAAPQSHHRVNPNLSMNLQDMSALHGHSHSNGLQHPHQQQQSSSSPVFAAPVSHLAHPAYGGSGHAAPPPLSPAALYSDGQPRSALMLDGHTPVDLDGGWMSGGNSGGGVSDGRLRSMSSDSAVAGPDFFLPSRGQSMELSFLNGGMYPTAASPAPLLQSTTGGGDLPGLEQHQHPHAHHQQQQQQQQQQWGSAAVLYPPTPNAHNVPTLSTQSGYSSSLFYAAPSPPRAAYIQQQQQQPTMAAAAVPQPAAAAAAAAYPQQLHLTSSSPPHQLSGHRGIANPAYASGHAELQPYGSSAHLQSASVSPISVKVPPRNGSALIPLTIQLRSGTGKKKIWPNRVVLSSPGWSFSQLLFHAANLSSFVSVSVEGEAMPGSDQRLRDSRAINDFLMADAHQQQGGGGAAPKIEVVFDLPANVKSCTRLGCPNLLVNKANRRACNVCQSQGADLFPGQIRIVFLPPQQPGAGGASAQPASSGQQGQQQQQQPQQQSAAASSSSSVSSMSAYLELYLDQFEHWKFDGTEEGLQYIVFTDEATAARVQAEMSSNLQLQSDSSQLLFPPPSILQPVDPSQSYTIRMKSHFWMLQVKPLDPNAAASKLRLYKKVGKPNQSRIGDKQANAQQVKAEKDEEAPAASGGKATAGKVTGGAGSREAQQEHSPLSEDSEGSSVHSYPSLPALAPHLLPSSPESFSDSSSISSPALNSAALSSRKRGLEAEDGGMFIDADGQRRDSLSSDGSSRDANGGESPVHAFSAFDKDAEYGSNVLSLSDSSFFLMQQNKPVQAMMNVVAAAIIEQPQTAGAGTAAAAQPADKSTASTASSASSSSSSGSVVSTPPTSSRLSTPVVLIYRNMEAYEKERRRMKKAGGGGGGGGGGAGGGGGSGGGGGGDKDTGSGSGRKDGGGGGGGGGGPGSAGRRDPSGGGDKDDGSSGKRRRVLSPPRGGDRQYQREAGTGSKSSSRPAHLASVPSSVLRDGDLRTSLLGAEGGHERQMQDVKSSDDDEVGAADKKLRGRDDDVEIDLSKYGAGLGGEQRLVAMPAALADMLEDRERLELLFWHLKQLPASSASFGLSPALPGPPSLLDKPGVLRTLRSYQSSNLCTYFTMALGLLSLILLALFASGQYENSPVLYKNAPVMAAPPNNSLSLLQSDSVVSSMRAISPAFTSWATAPLNSTGSVADADAGPGGGGGGSSSNDDLLNKTSVPIIIEKCVEATVVAKALGDWLLASQGLLAVYQAGQLQTLDESANSTCQALAETDVGFAHMKDLVCSPLNFQVHGEHVAKYGLCQETAGRAQFTLRSCMSMLSDLHLNNLTATVLLGLRLDDLPASSQYAVAQSAGSGADSRWLVTQYLNISRPWVQVVEMSAFNYYLQAATLTSACTTFSVINSMSLDFNKPPRSAAGQPLGPHGYAAEQQQQGSPRVIHPMILFVLLLGSTGLFLIMQMLLSGFVAGSLNVYRKIKRM